MNSPWRRRRRILLTVIVLIVAAATMRRPVLRAAGHALVVDEPIAPTDVIVVPQWAGEAGAIDAADLVRARIAARVAVLSRPPTPAEQELIRRGIGYVDETGSLVRLLRALGVPAIEVIPNAAAGTEAEGDLLPSWCEERNFQSVVVISTPDHSRRVRRTLRRSLSGRSTRVAIRAARYSPFDPDHWWETHDGLRLGIVELEKLLLDVARHPIS